MGEISSMQSIPTLEEFVNDERREVRETWDNSKPKRQNLKRRTRGSTSIRLLVDFNFCRQFASEDPSPAPLLLSLRPSSRPSTSYTEADISTLTKTILDPSLSLFVRYRALFTLRNTDTPAAIDALSSALLSPNEICSPLFKQAVVFAFGLISDPRSVPALLKVLEDEREEEMVRHEAAEESLRTGSCPCCESGPLKPTRPGEGLWWRSTCRRYVFF